MRFLVALKKIKTEDGFSLFELVFVSLIIGVVSAIGAPSLFNSLRDNEAKEALTKIRGSLIEAQINANRQSTNCTVEITDVTTKKYGVSSGSSPASCVLEPFTINKTVVSIESSSGSLPSISFDFEGDTGNAQTILISRKDASGNPIRTLGRCIVISSKLGMIRTGIYDGPSTGTFDADDCNNTENARYDSSNP